MPVTLTDAIDPSAVFKPNPGSQTDLMWRNENIILYCGEKGAGKSVGFVGWLMKGNPHEVAKSIREGRKPDPVDVSYLNHPAYRAIFIRKNSDDLNSWVDRDAGPVFTKLGATLSKQPREFTWEAPGGGPGAKIILGHLADPSSFMRYFGGVIHRIVVDESTFVVPASLFVDLETCPRSGFAELRPQVLYGCNPVGPSMKYFYDRFINIRDPLTGDKVPYGTTISEVVYNKYLKRDVKITRVAIFGKLEENIPLLSSDPYYMSRLDLIPDEARRRALRHGDWLAFNGSYFGAVFRPDGPLGPNEPANARHVLSEAEMDKLVKPWYPLVLGMDWGFTHYSAVFKGRLTPYGHLLITDEAVARETTPEEWGTRIAMWCMPEFKYRDLKHAVLHLSPEEVGSKGENEPRAVQIARGINRVLGGKACVVLDSETLRGLTPEQRREVQLESRISIRPANNQRVAGWQFLRSLMRWKPLVNQGGVIDWDYARKLHAEQGTSKYLEYLRAYETTEETIPKLLISERCKHLRSGIEGAVYAGMVTDEGTMHILGRSQDPEDILKVPGSIGDEVLDGLRYLASGYREVTEMEPLQDYLKRQAEEYRIGGYPPEEIHGYIDAQIDKWNSNAGSYKPFSLSRLSGSVVYELEDPDGLVN